VAFAYRRGMTSAFFRALVDVAELPPFVARRPGADSDPGAEFSSSLASPVPGDKPPSLGDTPRRVLDDHLDRFGVLAPLLADPRVTDVFVNGSAGTWVDRGAGPRREPDINPDEEDLRALAVRLVSLGGRHIDEAAPCVDARLGEGVRVHAVLPPVSTSGTLLSVRLPSASVATLDWLESTGFFAGVPRATVEEIVDHRRNVLITGAGGSGKTTLLSAMLGRAASTNRIIAIEDVAELRVQHPHFVALEARQANLEGVGAIGLDRLVREALRMRPDRLVLGECRGPEIRELLAALNTGHDGGAGTLHANSLEDVPARLEALGALAGMTPEAVARQAVSAIEVVLHLGRPNFVQSSSADPEAPGPAGASGRYLAQIGRFALNDRGRLAAVDLASERDAVADTEAAQRTAPYPRSRGAHAARDTRYSPAGTPP
jgi:pilus assembly protein CpaF